MSEPPDFSTGGDDLVGRARSWTSNFGCSVPAVAFGFGIFIVLAIAILAGTGLSFCGGDSNEEGDASTPPPAAAPSPAAAPPTIVVDSSPPATDPSPPTTTAAGTTPATTAATTTEAPGVLVPLAGPWLSINLPGVMDCGSISIAIGESPDQPFELEVIDGGEMLSVVGFGEGLADVLVTRVVATSDSASYEGVIAGEDAVDAEAAGIDFDFTAVFDSPIHATTHVGGSMEASGLTCRVDRPGEANFDGG